MPQKLCCVRKVRARRLDTSTVSESITDHVTPSKAFGLVDIHGDLLPVSHGAVLCQSKGDYGL